MKILKAAIDWWTAWVSILALPIFICIILLQYFQPRLSFSLFCTDGQPCIQQWVGALSGWVAVAIGIPTLRTLVGQLKEQRRQTEFLIGDATPTAVAADASAVDPAEMNIYVTNWNRRLLIIDRMVCSADFAIEIRDITIDDKPTLWRAIDENQGTAGKLDTHLPGWEERSHRPHGAKFAIRITCPQSTDPDWKRQMQEMSVHGRLVGETVQHVTLKVMGEVVI